MEVMDLVYNVLFKIFGTKMEKEEKIFVSELLEEVENQEKEKTALVLAHKDGHQKMKPRK